MLRQGALAGLRLHHHARCSLAVGQYDSYSHERARAPEGASGFFPAWSPCTVLINVEQIVCYSSSRRAPWESRRQRHYLHGARPDSTSARWPHNAMGTQQRRDVTAGAILLRLVCSVSHACAPAQSSACGRLHQEPRRTRPDAPPDLQREACPPHSDPSPRSPLQGLDAAKILLAA